MSTSRVKFSKIYLSLIATLGISATAQAQETENVVEKIAVTGSRIAGIGVESASPVTIISAKEIRASGVTNITQLLNKLPSMAPGITAASGAVWGNTGITTQNLRGQGAKRTLTLINGRRHVGSIPGESTVDMSTIPVALIKRIEILTGGASSIYGADAVAGVVNIITLNDYEGTEVTVNGGISDRNDGESYGFNLTHGLNFDDSRGNVVFHVTYDETKQALAGNRSFAGRELSWIDNPAEADLTTEQKEDNGIPDKVVAERYRLLSNYQASTMHNGVPYTFNEDGSIRETQLGNGKLYKADRGFGQAETDAGGEHYSQNARQLVQAPTEKFVFNTTINYELTDDIYWFTDLKFTKSEAKSSPGYHANYGGSAYNSRIYRDNAYIADSFGDYMDEHGLPSIEFAKTYRGFGNTRTQYERDLYQIVTAFEGTIMDDYSWETYIQYGKSSSDNTTLNDKYQGRWDASIDAVRDASGNTVCSVALSDAELVSRRGAGHAAYVAGLRDALIKSGSSVADCIPHNVFQAPSQELMDYLLVNHTGDQWQSQFVAHANIGGDLYQLPAGPLAFSAGVEYRREKSQRNPSGVDMAGIGGSYSVSQPVAGEYGVREAFVEFSIPVLENMALAQNLDLSVSARLADYTRAGSSTSWNLGFTYQPIDDIKFRVSRSKSARAPNINEQFTEVSTSGDWAYQPCGIYNIDRLDEKYHDNCRQLGVPFVKDETGKDVPQLNWYTWATLRSFGNTGLEVETANTLTAGLVFTPSFVDGLSMTLDYWDIKLDKLIGSFTHSSILTNCVESSSIDNQFCNLITRKENGEIVSIDLQTLNLNQRRTKGLDFESEYRFDAQDIGLNAVPGSFRLKALMQWLIERDVQTDPNLPLEPTRALFGYPEIRANLGLTYTYEEFELQWSSRYIGKQKRAKTYTAEKYSPEFAGGLWYTDISLTYMMSDDVILSAGINNLFDRGTPQMPDANVGGASVYVQNDIGLYDVFGKSYFANMTYRF